MIDFTIRKKRKGDYLFCRTLESKMTRLVKQHRKYTDEQIRASFEKDFKKGGVSIIEHKRASIGYYQAVTKNKGLYINELHLIPKFRNLGIGSYVMALVEEEARKKKLPVIRLEVFLNNRAKKLYDRFGYRIIKYTKDNSVMIMEKTVR